MCFLLKRSCWQCVRNSYTICLSYNPTKNEQELSLVLKQWETRVENADSIPVDLKHFIKHRKKYYKEKISEIVLNFMLKMN